MFAIVAASHRRSPRGARGSHGEALRNHDPAALPTWLGRRPADREGWLVALVKFPADPRIALALDTLWVISCAGNAADHLNDGPRGKAWDDALQNAIADIRPKFHQWCCPEVCWNEQRQ